MNQRLESAALATAMTLSAFNLSAHPVVIAHRGASGYLPEHTSEAATYAHALGADYIEQDVVMSKDGVLVVCHDIHIDTTTDVAVRYPERKREDGRYYAVDFTWAELRALTVRERFDPRTGGPVFPQRFPSGGGTTFRLCTMEEAILLIHGLNRSTGRHAGLYPEIKAPAWHAREGKDPGGALLELLGRHGYRTAEDNVFVQCFEPAELNRLRFQLKTKLKLVQLLGGAGDGDANYVVMRTPRGLAEIASYAQGIGPRIADILRVGVLGGEPRVTSLVADAHAAGLAVHPYTVRRDALPRGIKSIEALLDALLREAGVDGVFIDHPDMVRRFVAPLRPL